MAEETRHNDQPISLPSEDLYGFNPFAQAIANGIRKMPAPNGYVLAINGPWGAGKSSVINLVLHHLAGDTAGGSIKVIRFTPWWFRGEEALALAFFRELQAALNPSLGGKAKKLLPKIGARLLRGGGLVGSVLDVAAGGGGAVASNAMAYLESLIETNDSLEALHDELRAALGKLPHRFLIVIDDIDRLTPDESLLIFKLVKSVGQLPNVLYVLAYDRALAEKLVAERYPSEGPHFLEKIVQAVFEVPEPSANALQAQLQAQIAEICELCFDGTSVEFFNIFFDVVTPEIAKPRDLIRYMNTITFSWPAVAGEVDVGDFLALEALRLFDPQLYRSIRVNKPLVCGLPGYHRLLEEPREAYDAAFLKDCPDRRVARRKRALQRVFPPLEAIWANTHYGTESADEWARSRRACSPAHFETYFRFALGDESLPNRELDEVIARTGDRAFMERYLREAVAQRRADGSTKASLVLNELILRADDVPLKSIADLVEALFILGDEIDVEADEPKGLAYVDNLRRISWLIRRLTMRFSSIAERSILLQNANKNGSVATVVWFALSVWREHHPDQGEQPKPAEKCLLHADDAARFRERALERLRQAADSGALFGHRRLAWLLYRWRDFAPDGTAETKKWAMQQLDQETAICSFARAFTSYEWSQSGSDMVSIGKATAHVDQLGDFVDTERFRQLSEEKIAKSVTSKENLLVIQRFIELWDEQEWSRRKEAPDDY